MSRDDNLKIDDMIAINAWGHWFQLYLKSNPSKPDRDLIELFNEWLMQYNVAMKPYEGIMMARAKTEEDKLKFILVFA